MSDPGCDTCSFEANLVSQEPCMKCCHGYISKWKPVKKKGIKTERTNIYWDSNSKCFAFVGISNPRIVTSNMPNLTFIQEVTYTHGVEE